MSAELCTQRIGHIPVNTHRMTKNKSLTELMNVKGQSLLGGRGLGVSRGQSFGPGRRKQSEMDGGDGCTTG